MARRQRIAMTLGGVLMTAMIALAQTAPAPTPTPTPTQPAMPSLTTPTSQPTTQSAFDRLLGGDTAPADVPLKPTVRGGVDQTTGAAAIAPGAPSMKTMREGNIVPNRVGRFARAADGNGWEFVFNADGASLQDPPMKVLPNLMLMVVENQLEQNTRDMQFSVTGMVTEYRGRNYLLLEKVVALQDRR